MIKIAPPPKKLLKIRHCIGLILDAILRLEFSDLPVISCLVNIARWTRPILRMRRAEYREQNPNQRLHIRLTLSNNKIKRKHGKKICFYF